VTHTETEILSPQSPSPAVRLSHRRNLVADLRELLDSNQVLEELVKRDLKVRYKRSVLGVLWTLLNPLLMMIVTTVIFASFFRFAIDNFPVYFLSAYLVFGFFAQGTTTGCTSILTSAPLVRRIYLAPALFPLASVCTAGVNMIIALLPLLALMAFTGSPFTWALLSLPIGLLLTALFTYGVALFLSAASVFFHDTTQMYAIIITVWMYITPIFYPVEIVPEQYSLIVHLNPLFHFVEIIRNPLYLGTLPDPVNLGAATAYAFGAAVLGWWYFGRSRNAFASYL
jgi:ABC-type polysaccharide/polyol phosphate export permease